MSSFSVLGGNLHVVLILTLYLGSMVIWLPCEYKSAGEKLKAYYCSLPSILWCSSEKIANYILHIKKAVAALEVTYVPIQVLYNTLALNFLRNQGRFGVFSCLYFMDYLLVV